MTLNKNGTTDPIVFRYNYCRSLLWFLRTRQVAFCYHHTIKKAVHRVSQTTDSENTFLVTKKREFSSTTASLYPTHIKRSNQTGQIWTAMTGKSFPCHVFPGLDWEQLCTNCCSGCTSVPEQLSQQLVGQRTMDERKEQKCATVKTYLVWKANNQN